MVSSIHHFTYISSVHVAQNGMLLCIIHVYITYYVYTLQEMTGWSVMKSEWEKISWERRHGLRNRCFSWTRVLVWFLSTCLSSSKVTMEIDYGTMHVDVVTYWLYPFMLCIMQTRLLPVSWANVRITLFPSHSISKLSFSASRPKRRPCVLSRYCVCCCQFWTSLALHPLHASHGSCELVPYFCAFDALVFCSREIRPWNFKPERNVWVKLARIRLIFSSGSVWMTFFISSGAMSSFFVWANGTNCYTHLYMYCRLGNFCCKNFWWPLPTTKIKQVKYFLWQLIRYILFQQTVTAAKIKWCQD